ncbi:DeoR/GlpR family DNA-binding transcription regulator [Halobacillus sp. Marseille-Q1614]|uniref:DeoR/GlpR family DNA-binding transcription regulator n=1 Tax=Halobacillus sp. Marseille-Q1614 TaxID=2709134 RepID=UPI00156E68F2|nr:DeoR/GlpR family DNA-binding transcription regulator [Halobacillus sp. Marseille-Q1614]
MLTAERQRVILELLNEHQTVKLKEITDATGASDSTIRRDLDFLERAGKLRRIHGGASLRRPASEEPSMVEKSSKFYEEKKSIGRAAAELVQDGECIYIDAGSTTFEMIQYLADKNITAVTNGLSHLNALTELRIPTYIIGGYIKERTRAVIGAMAVDSLKQFRFDQCFMGVNGITIEHGFTTPDPEEAAVKRTALSLSLKKYFVTDASKFGEVSFSQIAEIDEAHIVTNEKGQLLDPYKKKTKIKVVTS